MRYTIIFYEVLLTYRAVQYCVGEEAQQKHLIVLSVYPSSTRHRMASHKSRDGFLWRERVIIVLADVAPWLVLSSCWWIWSCLQRKRSHVARVCTRRARGCGMRAVTVSCASACKFSVANDALETQCLYKTCTPGCAYLHEIWAPCYSRLETGLRHWVWGKREFRLKVYSRAHKYIQNTDE